MIIACPECTQPFQVEDGDIAPLVQIECPHCVFRMILDFEAANDASLIEAGMQMAQGFSSEAEYRTAVGAGAVVRSSVAAETSSPARLHAVPEPEIAPEPETTPELMSEPRSRVARTQPASEKPSQPPAAERAPVRQPEPVIEPEPELDKPPVRISRATFEPGPSQPTTPTRSRPTLIAHTAPPPALRPPGQSGVPLSVDEPGTPVPVESEVEVEVEMDEPQTSPDARHSPPHTPPVVPPSARAESVEPTHPAADSQSRPVAREADPGSTSTTEKKPSVAATVFKVVLLLLLLGVAGVMVWSLIETGNPNPLPMLQERFGI